MDDEDYKTTTAEYRRDLVGNIQAGNPLPPSAGYSYLGSTAADGILFFFWIKDSAKKEV